MFFKESLLFYVKNWNVKETRYQFRKCGYYHYSNRFFQKPDESEFQKLIQTVKDNPAEYKQILA